MANMLFANNANTTLASSLTAGATSMSVTSATNFPSPTGVQYFYCTLADAATQTTIEIVKVTSVSGTTFAITRGQDGTTGTAFAAGAVVSLRLVRASLNDFPKLDETNTFNADQAISGQLTSSAGLATTGTFTATAPSDGLVMDYATGFGRFSAFAGDGFQWYNAGIANTKLMQLSSSGVITTATWNGTTVGVAYGGTGTATSFTTGSVVYAGASGVYSQDNANFFWDATNHRLGIGTTSPQYALDVTSSFGIGGVGSNGNGLVAYAGASPSTGFRFSLTRQDAVSAGSVYLNSYGGIGFGVGLGGSGTPAGGPNMYLDTSGNLLVGTTGAVGLITAQQASNNAPGIYVNSTGASYTGTVIYAAASRNTTNGSFNAFTYYNTGASAFRFYVNDAGAIFSTSIVITAISDQRLKENVRDIDTGLSTIMALKPRRFDWKEGKGQDKKNVAGFIAQEFQQIFPNSVAPSKAGGDGIEYLTMNHEELIPTLVKAIQQLKLDFDAYVASHP